MAQQVAWENAIAKWWSSAPIKHGDVLPPCEMPETVIASTQDGKVLAAAVGAFIAGLPVPPGYDRAAVIVGRALARVISVLPVDRAAFDRAASFCSVGRDDFGAFESTFVAECRIDQTKVAAWTRCFEEAAEDPRSYLPFLGGDEHSASVRTMGHEGALWATKDYRAIWRYRGWSEWYRPDTLARFEILLDLDPAAFARAIDRVPSYPARQAIMECIELDKEPTLAVDLLASAPLFADPSGIWTGSTFALILLDTLARHAKRALHARIPQHFDASPQVPLDKSRIESLYVPFFHAVASRPDAPYLGMALSLETVTRATHPRAVAGTTWTVEEVALERCVDALTKMGTSFEDVQTDWRRTACAKLETDTSDQAYSPMSHLLVAACLLASRSELQRSTPGLAGLEEVSRTPDVAAKVWAWYQELLRSADAELGGHVNLYGEAARWVFDILGFTLASLDDPLSELKSQWLVLYEQRLRGRMVADVEAARPSFHLLRVARASLEWFVGGSEMGVASPERAESMWNCIHGIARQLPGSVYHNGTRRDRDVLTTLYAFLPGIRPDGWRDTLARDAPLFAVDEISCITAAANLVRNGVKASEVRTVMRESGCDPVLAGEVLRNYSQRIEPRDSAVIGALQLLEEVRA